MSASELFREVDKKAVAPPRAPSDFREAFPSSLRPPDDVSTVAPPAGSVPEPDAPFVSAVAPRELADLSIQMSATQAPPRPPSLERVAAFRERRAPVAQRRTSQCRESLRAAPRGARRRRHPHGHQPPALRARLPHRLLPHGAPDPRSRARLGVPRRHGPLHPARRARERALRRRRLGMARAHAGQVPARPHRRQARRDRREGIGWKAALIRAVVLVLAGLPLGLGWVWAFFEKEKRAFQDLAAGTWVVRSALKRQVPLSVARRDGERRASSERRLPPRFRQDERDFFARARSERSERPSRT